MNNEMMKVGSIEDLCAHRDRALALAAQALNLLVEAQAEMVKASPSASSYHYLFDYDDARWMGRANNFPDLIAGIRRRVDHAAWVHLRDATDLKNLMDATALGEFNDGLKDPPEFTAATATATFGSLFENRTRIFERGVVAAFRGLDAKNYKSNSRFKVGDRAVFKSVLNGWGWNRYGKAEQTIRDVERVFHILDGQPPPDHRADLARELEAVRFKKAKNVVTTPYFKAETFKNGNLHIRFLRPDLVDQVNRIIAKHYGETLPDDHERTAA